MILRYACLISVLILAAGAAAAQSGTPKLLGHFGNWNAFSSREKDQTVCYMTLTAKVPKNKKFNRADPYLMITHRPAENSKDVISYTAGYTFKAASEAEIHIGKNEFSLFTQKDTAWSRDAATDRALAVAIRNAKTMTVKGEPTQKGIPEVTDTINLAGAMEAYRAIGKACGLEVPEPPKSAKSSKPAPAAKKKPVKTRH